MTYDILATGSSGNCVIMNDIIALDCGVPAKMMQPHERSLQIVFIGHIHGDHCKLSTIRHLAAERPTLRFCGGEWMASPLVSCGVDPRNIDILQAGKVYDYGAFKIEAVELYHDVPNFGLKLYIGEEKAIYIVDTGYIDHVDAPNFHLYLLEANHTEAEIEHRIYEKRSRGEFAYETRASQNHLSREQAENWLAKNAGINSRVIYLHQHKGGIKQCP